MLEFFKQSNAKLWCGPESQPGPAFFVSGIPSMWLSVSEGWAWFLHKKADDETDNRSFVTVQQELAVQQARVTVLVCSHFIIRLIGRGTSRARLVSFGGKWRQTHDLVSYLSWRIAYAWGLSLPQFPELGRRGASSWRWTIPMGQKQRRLCCQMKLMVTIGVLIVFLPSWLFVPG